MKARLGTLLLLAIVLTSSDTVEVLPQAAGIRLDGRVLRLGTSEPIPNAEVFLVGMNPNLPNTVTTSTVINAAQLLNSATTAANDIQKRLLEATAASLVEDPGVSLELLRPMSTAMVVSDSMGNFRFTNLAAGRYSLSVTKEGFFAPSIGGTSAPKVYQNVRLEPTATILGINVFMVQGGSISGHVQDSAGHPVTNLTVEANERSYPAGKMTFTLKTSQSIDSGGNFRFSGLLPGEYFLSVRPPGGNSVARAGRVPVLAYYPNVADPLAAVPVTVNDASEVSGLRIEIAKRPADLQTPTFKISGFTVNNAPPNTTSVTDRSINNFYLVPVSSNTVDDTPLEFQNAIPVGARLNGEFEIRDVPPGRYELYPYFRLLYLQAGRFRIHTSRNFVELLNTDITNLQIVVKPGATLKAEIIAASASDWLKFNVLSLGMRVIDTMPKAFAAVPRQFDSTGRLTLENLPEARYAISVSGLPEDAYVSDVQQNGRSIFDTGFLLEEQSNPVQILVSRDGGTVSGRVRTPRGSTRDVTVVLVPPLARRNNAALFKTATIDEDGSFIIRGVAPGAYTLVSLENRPAGEPWLNADFMVKYEGRGRAIEVKAASAVQLDFIDR